MKSHSLLQSFISFALPSANFKAFICMKNWSQSLCCLITFGQLISIETIIFFNLARCREIVFEIWYQSVRHFPSKWNVFILLFDRTECELWSLQTFVRNESHFNGAKRRIKDTENSWYKRIHRTLTVWYIQKHGFDPSKLISSNGFVLSLETVYRSFFCTQWTGW